MERLIIITGASRGIGAALAIETNKKYPENTSFLLIARDLDRLNTVQAEMNKLTNNTVITLKLDFGQNLKTSDMSNIIKLSIEHVNTSTIKELYVFYNHGTLLHGKVEKVADDVLKEFSVNVSSVWILLASIRALFPIETVPVQFHINLSTLLASEVRDSCSAYNATRCARATLFKVLALENPTLRVLNYQPGPVYTDMLKQLYDAGMNEEFKTNYEEGKFLAPEETVRRLLEILAWNKFENGIVIDYYDSNE